MIDRGLQPRGSTDPDGSRSRDTLTTEINVPEAVPAEHDWHTVVVDARGTLQKWADEMRADSRLAAWHVEFRPGGDGPGSGATVEADGGDTLASVSAWPNGYVDLTLMMPGDADPATRTEVVSTEDVLRGLLRDFVNELLGLRPFRRSAWCPYCSAPLDTSGPEFRCSASNALFSERVSQRLVGHSYHHGAGGHHPTTLGAWYCPSCATRMVQEGRAWTCRTCGTQLDAALVHELVELNPHVG